MFGLVRRWLIRGVLAAVVVGVVGFGVLVIVNAESDAAWSSCRQEPEPPGSSGFYVRWDRKVPPRHTCVYTDDRGRIVAERRP
jgi:hypothetical protein